MTVNDYDQDQGKNGRASMAEVDLRVECYAGYRGDETPRRFYLGPQRIEVAAVIDRWLAPDHRYFKVEDTAGNRYLLRQDMTTLQWTLQTGVPTRAGN